MRRSRRTSRSTTGRKQSESPKWRAKAKELLPFFETRSGLRKAVLLFKGSAYMHWSALEEVSKGSCKLLEQKGAIHLLPDNRNYALTTVGKILLETFSGAEG